MALVGEGLRSASMSAVMSSWVVVTETENEAEPLPAAVERSTMARRTVRLLVVVLENSMVAYAFSWCSLLAV